MNSGTHLLCLWALIWCGFGVANGELSRFSSLHRPPAASSSKALGVARGGKIDGDMGGARNLINQFTAGAISGAIGLVVGHPFDTVKTRQQMAPPGKRASALKIAEELIKNEGVFAFMKGIHSPLVMTAWTNALAFTGYGESLRLLKPGSDGVPSKQYTYRQHFLAGVLSGALQAVAMSPTQLIKVKLQVQTGQAVRPGQVVYDGPVDCLVKIMQMEGIGGVFKGLTITALRDMWGFGVYYWFYQYSKNYLIDIVRMPDSYAMMLAGAATGVVAWVAEYPLDVIKTRIQCQPPEAPKEKLSILHTTKELWTEGGLPAFFVGVGTSIARAIPVDAALFLSYERALQACNALEDRFFGPATGGTAGPAH
eukprot:CAMPEP_0194560114 /NCGR_PEP_ID=MMETSP0292-20121207/1416_1 /TAXON_ID=39354 /ORGANISM="Heterosigma akashiwo, Strain CCMP2393" /LENGTH=366 /DNA_ID=CAMNT_0039408213 /DNA_START=44 /DNA_END=1144 /DNA_ORIENTATION=+